MRTGWLKLHRKTLDNPVVMKDGDHLAVWAWILCEAAYEPHQRLFGKEKITLQPGQLLISAQYIAGELKLSESKVKRILKSFESERQIEQRTERYGRLITVLRWNDYQDDERQSERQVTDKWTTSGRQVNETKESKKGRKKEDIYKDVPEEIKATFLEWATMRKQIKKPLSSKKAVTMALNALRKLSEDPAEQIKLIEYAIFRNWQSFYPIPKEEKRGNTYSQQPEPPKYEEFKPDPVVDVEPASREQMAEMYKKLGGCFG